LIVILIWKTLRLTKANWSFNRKPGILTIFQIWNLRLRNGIQIILKKYSKSNRVYLVYNKNYNGDYKNSVEHTSPQLKKYCKEYNAKMVKINLSTARDVEKIMIRLTKKIMTSY